MTIDTVAVPDLGGSPLSTAKTYSNIASKLVILISIRLINFLININIISPLQYKIIINTVQKADLKI